MNHHRKLPPRPVRLPYLARIMVSIGSDVVELFRFKRPIDPHSWRSWTEGREGRCTLELPLKDRQTITARPGSPDYERTDHRGTGERKRAWA